jgi:hypothetical protein
MSLIHLPPPVDNADPQVSSFFSLTFGPEYTEAQLSFTCVAQWAYLPITGLTTTVAQRIQTLYLPRGPIFPVPRTRNAHCSPAPPRGTHNMPPPPTPHPLIRLSSIAEGIHFSFLIWYSKIDIHLNTFIFNGRSILLLLPHSILYLRPSSSSSRQSIALLSGPSALVNLIIVRQLLLQCGPPHLALILVFSQLTLQRWRRELEVSHPRSPGAPPPWHRWARPVPFSSSDKLVIEDISQSDDNISVRLRRSIALLTSSMYPVHSLSAPAWTPTPMKVNRLSTRKRASAVGT